MPKKISITLLFMLMVAIFALFAATEVGAQYTGSFDTVGYTWFEHRGCRVEIVPPFPEVIDCPQSTGKCSKYTWEVTCPTSHSDILIRRDMEARIEQALCDGDPCTWETKLDGSGESSTTFGQYLIWNVVGKWNCGWSTINPHTLSLILTGDDLGRDATDFLIKEGQELKFGPIQGPAPFCVSVLGDYTPAAVEEVMTIKSVQIKIQRNPTTGCGIGLKYSLDGGTSWFDVDPTDPPTVPDPDYPNDPTKDVPVVDCGEISGKSGCLQECIFTAAASPGWTYLNLGGTWYKVWIPY